MSKMGVFRGEFRDQTHKGIRPCYRSLHLHKNIHKQSPHSTPLAIYYFLRPWLHLMAEVARCPVFYRTACPVFWLYVRYENDGNTGHCMCKKLNILSHRQLYCQCPVFWREPPGNHIILMVAELRHLIGESDRTLLSGQP